VGAFERIAEQRIQEAIETGAFDDLPGAGAPLVLDDTSMIPEHLRSGYRILRNAGVPPSSLALRASISELERRIAQLEAGEQRRGERRRLALLMTKLEAERGCRRPARRRA
jgi:hypothetical protein